VKSLSRRSPAEASALAATAAAEAGKALHRGPARPPEPLPLTSGDEAVLA
jgi:hypothetical protein